MRGEVMKRLAQLTEQRGNYQKALQYYKSYALVRDSLSYEQQNQRLDELRAAFETEQKEIEIQQLKSQEAQRTQERNYLIGGIIMLGLLGWYIFSLLRKNNRQLKTEVQQKKRIENLLLEKNQLFDDLQNAQERLIHNEKMASLGQLTAGIAHEINNPINFISTSTQALNLDFEDLKELLEKVIHLQRNGKDESTIQEIIQLSKSMDLPYLKDEIYSLLGSVTRGVSRTEKIISGLRTYSRRGENEFLPDDINNCIKEALLILEPKITTQIQVHQDLQQLPLVECQIDKLNQVFVNLIGNGIDAMEGNGELFISTQNTDNQVIIKIRDTGKGMDKITQQRIFEPFFSTKKIGKGTGLGLFISYGVVKQHGGEIKVESEIGEGTTFSIYLPIQHGKLISSLR
ncbi:MAG: ATP-binding protein [Bacteroidota bacterium]